MSLFRQSATYFFATFANAALSVALLPFATRVLGPDDFGTYGFVLAVVMFASGFADAGVGILLAEHYPASTTLERRKVLTTVAVVSVLVSGGLALMIYAAWQPFSSLLAVGHIAPEVALIPEVALMLACVSMPFRTFSSVSTTVFILQGRSAAAAYALLSQGGASFSVTLISLFAFDAGMTSLFAGNAAGAIVGASVALIALRRDLSVWPAARWVRALIQVAPSGAASGLMESSRPLVETHSILRGEGAAGVGIFNYARMYYGFLSQVVNSVGYALWPLALQEGRNRDDDFKFVGRVWNGVYFSLTVVGVTFALFAHEMIDALTNGKFVEAALWPPILVAYLLIQNSGKAATAILYASMKGALVARLRAATLFIALVSILALGSSGGIVEVIGIAFSEMIVFRLLLQNAARRIRTPPFQDWWVVSGAAMIVSITFAVQDMGILHRIGLFAVLISFLGWVGRSVVIEAWFELKKLRAH